MNKLMIASRNKQAYNSNTTEKMKNMVSHSVRSIPVTTMT